MVVLVFGVPFWFASALMARIFSFVFSNSFKVTCAFRHTQRPHPCKKKDGYSVQMWENGVSPCFTHFREVDGALRVLADLAWLQRMVTMC